MHWASTFIWNSVISLIFLHPVFTVLRIRGWETTALAFYSATRSWPHVARTLGEAKHLPQPHSAGTLVRAHSGFLPSLKAARKSREQSFHAPQPPSTGKARRSCGKHLPAFVKAQSSFLCLLATIRGATFHSASPQLAQWELPILFSLISPVAALNNTMEYLCACVGSRLLSKTHRK